MAHQQHSAYLGPATCTDELVFNGEPRGRQLNHTITQTIRNRHYKSSTPSFPPFIAIPPSSSYDPEPGHLSHEILPNTDLRAARVHKGGVEVAGTHAADVVEPPGETAGALRLGRVAAGAGRVARVVAALVGEAEELVARHALVADHSL
ncbi:hypothetical protein PG993_002113 [Apiospora rasikravindrae]|uniref:Uncharacterized protein n=1 Tax=Apiospora rasikravindrae TaxID=990691 RepID=A0ABR1UFJ9_9PEZI